MKQVHELFSDDRPREKLLIKGPGSLKNRELIAAILGSGQKGFPVMDISRSIELLLEKDGLDAVSIEKLTSVEGIGIAKACQITASFELAKRFYTEPEKVRISASKDIAILLDEYSGRHQEHFITITLDGANNVINVRVIFIGTLNRSLVHPREVFAPAFADRAASVIVAHNHPSGIVEPSIEDINITQRLVEAGKILGIEVLDHVILTKKSYYSFQGNGKM
ncbi:MAG TPA: DNA repair protein RadC [bacterium]|nr:DNA repair protein RadC [bacterium]HPS28747.1 DNA repair protein RadC [bacterium]